MFKSHYHENLDARVSALYSKGCHGNNRDIFGSKLMGRNMLWSWQELLRVSYLPRILPSSYQKVIEDASRLVLESLFSTAYSNGNALKLPGLGTMLIEEFKILERLPKRIIGTARFDFAILGKPTASNPPKLLEVNMLDYGGNGWVQDINESLLETIPELSGIVASTPLIDSMAENFKKLGDRALFVCEEDLGYTDFTNFARGSRKKGLNISLMLDTEFFERVRGDNITLSEEGICLNSQKRFDFIYLRALSTVKEIGAAKDIVEKILASNVPMYDSLAGLLLENKSALPIFQETAKKLKGYSKNLADKVFLHSNYLNEELKKRLIKNPRGYVLKYSDDHFGQSVYVGKDMLPVLRELKDYTGWCIQDFIKLNTIDVWPLDLKKPVKGIVDLAVYVNYEWNSENLRNKLESFSVSGQLCRTSTSDYKVNVSSGGCFVPIFFSKY